MQFSAKMFGVVANLPWRIYWKELESFKFSCTSERKRWSYEGTTNLFKELFKALVHKLRLSNNFEKNKRNYSKHRNLCVSVVWKSKSWYFSKIDQENVTHKKSFWKMVETLFFDEVASNKKFHTCWKRSDKPASSSPRADHAQFLSAIYICNF